MYFSREGAARAFVPAMLVLLFILSLLPLMHVGNTLAWDTDLLRYIHLSRNVSQDGFFRILTDSAALVTIGIPLVFLLAGLLLKKKSIWQQGLGFAAIFLTAMSLSTAFKYLLNKPRPFVTYDFIEKATSGNMPSFPSGHTTDVFVTALALSLVYRKWYVILPAFTWALLVAYSRLSLGVHYPSDVLAGIALGSFTAVIGCRVWAAAVK
ncbi:phosphatase PAP2 family protein [Chitinophaga barathri]|nr:phosphatase PAP2 family protein [Chitinophaga barathri]